MTGHGKVESIEAKCLDIQPGMFRVPLALAESKVGMAFMTYRHQLNGHHWGMTTTYVESLSIFHILGGRKLAGTVRAACPPCIFSQRRMLQQHLGPLHTSRLLLAPAFMWPAVDIFGPFKVKCMCGSNHRASSKAWILVIRCPSTNAISAEVMETLSSAEAYSCHASRYSHAQHITSDQGSQFMSLGRQSKFSYADLTIRLQSEYQQGGIRVIMVPAGDHSANSMAEQAIGTLQDDEGNVHQQDIFHSSTSDVCLSRLQHNQQDPICPPQGRARQPGPHHHLPQQVAAGARQQARARRPGQGQKPQRACSARRQCGEGVPSDMEPGVHQPVHQWGARQEGEVHAGQCRRHCRLRVSIGDIVVFASA